MVTMSEDNNMFPFKIGEELTPEIASYIFNMLDPTTLKNCRLVSKAWKCFVDYHTGIWRDVPPHEICKAARQGRLDICKLIIENREDKNPRCCEGETPLHYAAEGGHYHVCKYIIDNVDEKNPAAENGWTPLHICAQSGNLELCKLIVDSVEDKNPPTEHGVTPLHNAAMQGHLHICEHIVNSVKDPADRNPLTSEWSPLHYAAQEGHIDICKLILESVHDKNPCNHVGCTPLHLAADEGHLDICKLIMEHVEVKATRTNSNKLCYLTEFLGLTIIPTHLSYSFCFLG